ncbi:MAG TPA: mercuric reductase [Anaeromyxobacteraceae bacterium]|nr:mercuric reductase [Anaeromyxobacteraceae bacterium]
MQLDTIVIGTGQAGVPLAERLARTGQRVLVAERSLLGGTCVNYGCTPTKTMVASARAAHVARTAGRLGVHATDVRVDLAEVVRRKDAVVARWITGIEKRLAGAGENLRLVRGAARFVGEREIELAGERHRAGTIVIDVGARAAEPPVTGIDRVPWLDNRRVMELTELPEHLIVLGGGYVGCEFAQMFRRFGARVTVVQSGEHLLDREDADISEEVENVFRGEGIDLLLGSAATSVEGDARRVRLSIERHGALEGTHLLVATGRRPNTDDLGCERAGVELDERGYVKVDEHFRTTADGVFAVGDVTGGPQFTHTAWDDHRLVFDVLMGRPTRGRSEQIVPYTAFTDPQVAGVGLNERAARAKGVEYVLGAIPFGHVARAIETDETAGRLKVLVDPKSERILGAAIVGAEAGELVHVFAVLMQAGASVRNLVDMQIVHPTYSEGLQSVVMSIDRFGLR